MEDFIFSLNDDDDDDDDDDVKILTPVTCLLIYLLHGAYLKS
jgi:hypothetical protein